jgi:hypothetical protein
MWSKTYSTIVNDVTPAQIWQVWSDVENRPQWDIDTEWAELGGPFAVGSTIRFKPKGGPKVSLTITECILNQRFTDCFKFFGSRLYGIHEIKPIAEGLRIITTIKVEGLLWWVLKKLIGEKVAAEVPEQTEMLIKIARSKTDII